MRNYRNTSLTFILIFIGFLCYGQKNDSTVFNSEETQNLNIRLLGQVKSVIVTIEKVELENKEEIEYYFDIKGQPTKIIQKSLEYDPIANDLKNAVTNFEFNNGLLDSKLNTKVSGLDGCLYDHDDKGNIINKKYYFDNCLTSEKCYEFDEFNRLTKSLNYSYGYSENNSNVKLSKKSKYLSLFETFAYDDSGNLIVETLNNVKGNVYKKYFYSYDNYGNKIEDAWIQDYKNNKSDTPTPSQGYQYNLKGELIRKYSIGDWVPHNTDTYYEYDDKGNQTESKGYYIEHDTTLGYHYKYQYDNFGNKIREEEIVGGYRPFGFESYKILSIKYDKYQNVILEEYLKNDGSTVKVVRYNYVYDTNGNWIELRKEEGKIINELTLVELIKRVIKYY